MNYSDLAKAIRFLSADMVEAAKSGHPGLPLGMADVMAVLFADFIKFNPHDPNWPDRDRFILSAGHGSPLLYSLLYLTGYEDMTIDELKKFRQLGSKTPGHPEFGMSSGVETTTGPLGQGLANAVGMAIAERMLNAQFNDLVNHKTYALVGDGCLMEGISQEAISLAGHLQLKNLIVIHDDNRITIDGSTDLTTSESQSMRFLACGWKVYSVDGHNPQAIYHAFSKAQSSSKPVYIAFRTNIAQGAPNKAGSHHAHGSPLGASEISEMRETQDWQHEPFDVPHDIMDLWRNLWQRNEEAYKQWNAEYDKSGGELKKYIENSFVATANLAELKKTIIAELTEEASRLSSGKAITALAQSCPNLVGGSADLTGSNNTKVTSQQVFSANNYSGSYIHYGIREHAMAAVMNGIALHRGFIPYGGTFLTFSDYARPAIRLSALSKQQVIYVMTHDSIGLGEDGPTHQPVEHLAALRAIPGLYVFRPCDAVETAECWEVALKKSSSPSLLALSRQNLKLQRTTDSQENLSGKGAYILHEAGAELAVTIFASGSEVGIASEARQTLENEGIGVRVISVPCLDLFYEQDLEYQMFLTCNKSLKVAIEAGIQQGWERVIGPHGIFFGMHHFGESAPYQKLYQHFGLTAENMVEKIRLALTK
jgi:transketolase